MESIITATSNRSAILHSLNNLRATATKSGHKELVQLTSQLEDHILWRLQHEITHPEDVKVATPPFRLVDSDENEYQMYSYDFFDTVAIAKRIVQYLNLHEDKPSLHIHIVDVEGKIIYTAYYVEEA